MNIRLIFILLGVILWGCERTPPPPESAGSYFSLDNYFGKEIERLNLKQPLVEKTVKKNDQQEKRSLKELDWAVELKAFKSSDINKPAWRNSYSADSTEGSVVYTATEDGLRVRTIRIRQNPEGRILSIVIERAEENYLYTSNELLKYYPDSLYFIERHQKVRVLGPDAFQVSGRF
ncbi:hypothetical protein EDD80_10317 [Anseongella ginsenosidimutans]|uniref:Uncharacterized protein n=1 Tax=Anseongella ginsenosidimutans TaxID=496056 RepID=A0A4R3KSH6_9SPHI|nr:hypothetical protein [Anseongella ginsenosidimutans]QEC53285.1 hypothetical protein FRZ59_13680 [Anseongella ginsenosidimutans]TCS88156.1 hypothetical protein EDD80_10317 [Anseongella ginsenosidimutans]